VCPAGQHTLNIYEAHPEQESIIYLQELFGPNPFMEYKWNMAICIPGCIQPCR